MWRRLPAVHTKEEAARYTSQHVALGLVRRCVGRLEALLIPPDIIVWALRAEARAIRRATTKRKGGARRDSLTAAGDLPHSL